jgi:hypothetical protein
MAITPITRVLDSGAVTTGRISIDVAGTGSIILTPQQALNRVMEFTGILTGNRTVLIDPTQGAARVFLTINSTTGAFSLTIKLTTGGSTGIQVSQGARAELTHNDTNVEYATPEI